MKWSREDASLPFFSGSKRPLCDTLRPMYDVPPKDVSRVPTQRLDHKAAAVPTGGFQKITEKAN
jgi:hypothetical protein